MSCAQLRKIMSTKPFVPHFCSQRQAGASRVSRQRNPPAPPGARSVGRDLGDVAQHGGDVVRVQPQLANVRRVRQRRQGPLLDIMNESMI